MTLVPRRPLYRSRSTPVVLRGGCLEPASTPPRFEGRAAGRGPAQGPAGGDAASPLRARQINGREPRLVLDEERRQPPYERIGPPGVRSPAALDASADLADDEDVEGPILVGDGCARATYPDPSGERRSPRWPARASFGSCDVDERRAGYLAFAASGTDPRVCGPNHPWRTPQVAPGAGTLMRAT